ncbi:HAMP domain-containing sensor histidine kinase [Aneurinibacillus sp. Ricciae_BoGa-3]|uniref:sensor histidine kinase n=1 Tax=Aneurinibacillus sp. Ricciae_BoGa-3 TaxID=3022697 RepID=UPI0023415031|nr:HAMP domain-containing sensor histidine kinase [Aneurinibacillus sp. Ricciae_BoGa-3]WCK53481.1 HAMP domain-containing sensor histidine kinase [Aneurinibacillus sp. Ricciae_BoGa-3]
MVARIFSSWAVWRALAIILIALFLPVWFGLEKTGIYPMMASLEIHPTGNLLMVSVLSLMIYTTLYALPNYLGCFLLSEQLGEITGWKPVKFILPILMVPAISFFGYPYYSLASYFGPPDILMLVSIVFIHRFVQDKLGFAMKALILAQLSIGFQWLDVIPILTPAGFGHHPVLLKMKEIAGVIGFDQALALYSLILFLIFVVNAIILAIILAMAGQKMKIRKALYSAQLEAIESRSGREVLQLVHDLKTPLTSIEGLISLIDMRVKDAKIKDYCRIISQSIASMSEMISEMLYEDRKNWCSIRDLMNYVRASRLSGTGKTVVMQLPEQDAEVWINKIRVTRAIVNLIDNAFDAIQDRPDGKVCIRVETEGKEVVIRVSDNGQGMASHLLDKIWQAGYSTKRHPGLGLSFVKQVAEGHKAYITVDSKLGQGTTVSLHLERGDDVYENTGY